MRLSSSSVRDNTSKNLMASKLRNQSNHSSVRVSSVMSHRGNKFIRDLHHHHASSLSKLPRACPRVTVRNLCLRRVFSPSSISSDWDFHVKGQQNQTKELNVESACDTLNSNVAREGNKDLAYGLVATGDDLEVVECSQTTPPDLEMFTGAQASLVKDQTGSIRQGIHGTSVQKVGIKLGSNVILHPCSRKKIFKNPASVSYRRLLPYLMEAADGTRDAELMAAKDRFPDTGPVLQSANNYVKPTAQSLHGNISPSKKMTSSNATKFSMCSQRKLFKVPGSVNYRRMLSFLKENSEDNSGTPETSKHIDPQKNIKEIAPATEDKGAAIEAEDLNTCSNNVEAPLSDPENEQETQTLLAVSVI